MNSVAPVRETTARSILTPTSIAFYRRVSNDELKERGTIENQREYLHRKYAPDLDPDSPQPMHLVGDFSDDGYSGAIPLEERPDGRRLIEAASLGQLDAVVIYKLDRLGRTAKV